MQLRIVHTYPARHRGGDGNVWLHLILLKFSGIQGILQYFNILTVQHCPLGCLIETTLSNGNMLYSSRCWVIGDTMALGRMMHYQRNQ